MATNDHAFDLDEEEDDYWDDLDDDLDDYRDPDEPGCWNCNDHRAVRARHWWQRLLRREYVRCPSCDPTWLTWKIRRARWLVKDLIARRGHKPVYDDEPPF